MRPADLVNIAGGAGADDGVGAVPPWHHVGRISHPRRRRRALLRRAVATAESVSPSPVHTLRCCIRKDDSLRCKRLPLTQKKVDDVQRTCLASSRISAESTAMNSSASKLFVIPVAASEVEDAAAAESTSALYSRLLSALRWPSDPFARAGPVRDRSQSLR